jgi:hypothetical protein
MRWSVGRDTEAGDLALSGGSDCRYVGYGTARRRGFNISGDDCNNPVTHERDTVSISVNHDDGEN